MCSVHHNLVSHTKLNSLELLPTELLNVIFDDFHQDVASLKACSLVSQTIRPVCQAHIFHTATLEFFIFNTGTGPILSHCHFLDTISNSPYIASLVRELRFTKPRNSSVNLLRVSEEERVVHQEVVAQILVTLPQLKTLVLRTPSGSLIWSRLSVALTTALSQVVQLSTLHHLDLGVTWEVPASFFRSLSDLQVLRFAELNIPLSRGAKFLVTADDVEKLSYDLFEHKSLQSLSILSAMSYPCINALFLCSTRLLDITRLQSLTLAFIDGRPIVRQMLEICGKSLHTFKMHMQQREETPNHELDFGLQHLERVTSLTFSSSMAFGHGSESSIVSWLALTLHTLPLPERLEHLTIIFEILHVRDVSNWSDATWSTLNTLPVGFPGLNTIHFLFYLRTTADPTLDNERLSSLVRERAVQLANTKILEVNIIPELLSCFR